MVGRRPFEPLGIGRQVEGRWPSCPTMTLHDPQALRHPAVACVPPPWQATEAALLFRRIVRLSPTLADRLGLYSSS